MSDKLSRALETVARERDGKFNEAFSEAARVVEHYANSDLAECVISDSPPSTPWEIIADLLGILQWITKDNGAKICRTTERWLIEGTDIRKIQIALDIETYLFNSEDRMKLELERLANEWPEVASRCRALIKERKGTVAKRRPPLQSTGRAPGKPGHAGYLKRWTSQS